MRTLFQSTPYGSIICGKIVLKFPNQRKAANVSLILKANKDHIDPLTYRPIALKSCLYKVMEPMINTRFIRHLEKSGILKCVASENIAAREAI